MIIDETKRYARLEDGAVTEGPGPMPRYVYDEHGAIPTGIQPPEWFDEQGWVEVEQRGWRALREPELEQYRDPVVTVEDGEVTETWRYEWVTGWREILLGKIDQQAESERAVLISALPGQVLEYQSVLAEAERYTASAASGTTASAGDYPLLRAGINNDVDPTLERPVATVAEAAALVIRTAAAWRQAGAGIRSRRLAAKKAVREAADAEAAWTAYQSYLNGTGDAGEDNPGSGPPIDSGGMTEGETSA